MNSKKLFAIFALLSLTAISAHGELTEYQQGVYAGLKAGMMIGKLLGAAPYDPSQAQQFNAQVDLFNQGLIGAFGDNQTAINAFKLQPYSATAAAKSVYSGKPVHSIDGSWNQSNVTVLGDVDEGTRIYDMPASSYYTWVGNAPSLGYSGGYNNLGSV
ncbi:MAG: hypothetical protein GYA39_01855 [Methanothrix sp.]|nr:hypothetical protein [Methanothrix sp.]